MEQILEHLERKCESSSNFADKTCHDQWMSEDYEPDLVSVVLPTFNRANFLIETLDSVKHQTYRPIELIVVDDGSTDNTKLLIEQWMLAFVHDTAFRIRYFYQNNKGAPAARNLGLIKSKGEYIQYLDSDDILHPMRIEIHTTALNLLPKCEYAWSGHRTFEGDQKTAFTDYNIQDLATTRIVMGEAEIMKIPNTGWSGLYRRSLCILTGPWNENLVRWQDFEYNVRSAYLRPNYRRIDACLYFWRNHSFGRVEDLNKSVAGIQEAFKSLNAVQNFLQLKKINTTDVRCELVRYYFLIACQAMKSGTSDQIHAALNGALEQSVNRKLSLKIKLLRWIYTCFGGKFSLFSFNTYSQIMLNFAFARNQFLLKP